MQLKSITLLAASLALVQAGTWADNQPTGTVDKPSVPVGGGDKPQGPTGKPSTPVEGGDRPTRGPPTDKPNTPVEGGEKPTRGPPTGKPSRPVDGGETSVADETASKTWSDVTSISTPVADTSSEPVYWGDETSVADETTTSTAEHTWSDVTSDPVLPTSTTSAEHTWSDVTSEPVLPTTTVSADHTWSDYTPPAEETPVSGGQGNPGKPEQPVSGGNGNPGKPEQPVSGGNGAPAGPHCGVVYETVVNTVTVTVQPGKPTPAVPVVDVSTEAAHTWGDAATLVTSTRPRPTGAPSGGYYGIVEQWRAQLGLPDLAHDSKLEANAQDAANSSGGQLKHKLNPGSMAQVLAPGNSGNFEKVFVGGWLCEMPNLKGLGSGVCNEFSKGWDYAGQTGHAKILTDQKYTKIGCGLGDGIWACDLA